MQGQESYSSVVADEVALTQAPEGLALWTFRSAKDIPISLTVFSPVDLESAAFIAQQGCGSWELGLSGSWQPWESLGPRVSGEAESRGKKLSYITCFGKC